MKYFLDTEFLEGTQNKTFLGFEYGKTPPTIDLISIGIVTENNKEYYTISKEFNLKEAWNRYDLNYGSGDQRNLPPQKIYWIRENILKPIFLELSEKELQEKGQNLIDFCYKDFKYLINKYGKTNNQIAEEIKEFVYVNEYKESRNRQNNIISIDEYLSEDRIIFTDYTEKESPCANVYDFKNIEFYGYYADYDWVVFCWLFGKMNNLPAGFPYYAKDLKQIMDEKLTGNITRNNQTLDPRELIEIRAMNTKEERIEWLKKNSNYYPKQTNVHNSLSDAIWNKQLHEFLNTL